MCFFTTDGRRMPDPVSRNLIRSAIRKLNENNITGEQALHLLCAHIGSKANKRTLDACVFQNHHEIFGKVFKDVSFTKTLMNADVIGYIYEVYLQYGICNYSKDYGQYFTHTDICKEIIDLCEPKENESICDPAMGTGGMLISYIQYMLKNKYRRGMIDGFDIDPRVVRLGKMNMNMYIPSNDFDVVCQDTLISGLPTKYDIIITNLPFGVKKYDYDLCCETIQKNNVMCGNSVPLFVQLIVNSLNEDGRAVVIVPEVFLLSPTAQHKNTRKWLLANVSVSKVIRLSGRFFMNTKCQPYMLVFKKPQGRMMGDYRIEFSEIRKEKDNHIPTSKKILGSISYQDVDKLSYSLHTISYFAEVSPEEPTLENKGDVSCHPLRTFCYVSKGRRVRDHGSLFPYIDVSGECRKYVDECTCPEPVVLTPSVCNIGKILFVDKPCHPSDNMVIIQPINKNVLSVKYLYYYSVFSIKPILKKYTHGIKPTISLDVFEKIYISVPPIETQEKVVDIIDDILKTYTIDEMESFSVHWIDAIVKGGIGRLRNSFVLYQQTILLKKYMKNYIGSLIYTKPEPSQRMLSLPLSELVVLNPETAKETEYIDYIDLSSVRNGVILKTQHLPWNERPKRASRKVRNNDIIIGTLRPQSRTHAFIEDLNNKSTTIVSTAFVVIRCVNTELILPSYLYNCIITKDFISYLERYCSGMYHSFNPSVILDYKIVIPSIGSQREFLNNIKILENSDSHFSEILTLAKIIKNKNN